MRLLSSSFPRALVVAGLAVALSAGAVACGDDDDASGDAAATTTAGAGTSEDGSGSATSTPASDAAMPTVTGAFGETPTITMPEGEPPTTLQVEVLEEGDGPAVAAGDQVTADYVGVLWRDGSAFDSSFERGQPATFPVGTGNLIPGWDEGLVGLNYGSRVLLVIPPDKGYGSGGNPQAGIEGTDTLVFVVDLVEKAG